MIVNSPLINQASGNLANTQWGYAGNQLYVRTLGAWPNTKSTKQQTQRLLFSTASATWKTLTESQREGWISLGALVIAPDALGNALKLSGLQCFLRCSMNLIATGQDIILDAPAAPDVVLPPTTIGGIAIAPNAVPAGEVFTVSPPPPASGAKLLIYASALQSVGVSSIAKNKFRLIKVMGSTDTVPFSLLDHYQPIFGHVATGHKIGLKASTIGSHGFASVLTEQIITTTQAA